MIQHKLIVSHAAVAIEGNFVGLKPKQVLFQSFRRLL